MILMILNPGISYLRKKWFKDWLYEVSIMPNPKSGTQIGAARRGTRLPRRAPRLRAARHAAQVCRALLLLVLIQWKYPSNQFVNNFWFECVIQGYIIMCVGNVLVKFCLLCIVLIHRSIDKSVFFCVKRNQKNLFLHYIDCNCQIRISVINSRLSVHSTLHLVYKNVAFGCEKSRVESRSKETSDLDDRSQTTGPKK